MKNKTRRKYIRDSRSPTPKNEMVSRTMGANRSKETAPEVLLRKALWKTGLRGYRKNWRNAPGRPDIAFPGKKIAIFVNGCFWHHCPVCRFPIPKNNRAFWLNKFKANKKRDTKKKKELEMLGWKVVVFWEHETTLLKLFRFNE